MEDYQIVEENAKRDSLLMVLLTVIFLSTVVIAVTVFLVFMLVGFELSSGNDPNEIGNYTLGKFLLNIKTYRTYEEFYNVLNDDSTVIKSYETDELGVPRLEYTNKFYNFDSEYYDHCNSKKVKLNYSEDKRTTIVFNYKSNEIQYSVNLYKDLYEFSDKLKTEDCYFRGERYTRGYFDDPYNTAFMKSVAEDFEVLKEKYSEDELVEIATLFVQSIDYGTDATELNRYPYETFYEQEGNCLDKSIILAYILDYLGYTTFIFLGQSNEYHALVGIVCEEGSNVKIGDLPVCFIETTTYAPIGTPEEIDIDKTVDISVGNKVYKGASYGPGTVKTIKEKNIRIDEIDFLIQQINDDLKLIQVDMCSTDCVICNNNIIDFARTEAEIGECYDANFYNQLANEYNEKVKEYNNLIEEWYKLYYDLEKIMFENVELVKRG